MKKSFITSGPGYVDAQADLSSLGAHIRRDVSSRCGSNVL